MKAGYPDMYRKIPPFTTPILMLVFNRPDYFKIQLDLLRGLRPSLLYVAADGPRRGNLQDKTECKKVRELISTIDWKCEVKTLFAKENQGCKVAVSSAINWFFDDVKQGIIIEDDCLADLTFFPYCQELLEKYKDEKEIMHISGFNPLAHVPFSTSFSVTIHPLCWGWATWRRAWKKYEVNMKDWPKKKKLGLLESIFKKHSSVVYWGGIFEKMYKKEIDTWDYQWVYAIFKERGVCLFPKVNMITNIGFDQRATHTKVPFAPQSHRKQQAMKFPLQFPKKILQNLLLDDAIQLQYEEPFFYKLVRGIKQYFYMQ